MQLNMASTTTTVCLAVIVVLGFISLTAEAQKNVAKKQQFRGNTNYQYFLQLEQNRRLRTNELERTPQKRPTAAPPTTNAPRTTIASSTTSSSTSTTTTTKATPIISRRSRTKITAANDTITAATSRSSTREVIRRKKKASVHLDSDNEIKNDVEEEDQRQSPMEMENQRFLSPSVRKYLALGRAIPGRPGTDYPILSQVPYTNFYCDDQEYPGFFADMETRCQGWHYCDIDGRQATFLCPNGTQFSQAVFVCDWWFNVPCELSPKLYSLNARLYQRPKASTPPTPHRIISKVLIDEMFN